MKVAFWSAVIIGALLLPGVLGCGKQPAGPSNHNPVLTSLSVVPASIGPADSAVVTCIASDPDGDSLVYDWSTDQRLRIKGMPIYNPVKPNSPLNYETFYPNFTPPSPETVYVACTVRDGIGGGAAKAITFVLHP